MKGVLNVKLSVKFHADACVSSSRSSAETKVSCQKRSKSDLKLTKTLYKSQGHSA